MDEEFKNWALPKLGQMGYYHDSAKERIKLMWGYTSQVRKMYSDHNPTINYNLILEMSSCLPAMFFSIDTDWHENLTHALQFCRPGETSVVNIIKYLPFLAERVDAEKLNEIIDFYFEDNRWFRTNQVISLSWLASHCDVLVDSGLLDDGSYNRVLSKLKEDRMDLPLYSFGHIKEIPYVGEIINSSMVVPTKWTDKWAGQCPLLEEFFDQIISSEGIKDKDASIVCLDRKPIGLIKYKGDNTMLALESIKHLDGYYPLVMGGVYSLDSRIVEMGYDSKVIHTGGFRAKPLRFIGSYKSGDGLENYIEKIDQFKRNIMI